MWNCSSVDCRSVRFWVEVGEDVGRPPCDVLGAVAAGVCVVRSSKSIYIGCRDPKSDQHKPFFIFCRRVFDWTKM